MIESQTIHQICNTCKHTSVCLHKNTMNQIINHSKYKDEEIRTMAIVNEIYIGCRYYQGSFLKRLFHHA